MHLKGAIINSENKSADLYSYVDPIFSVKSGNDHINFDYLS